MRLVDADALKDRLQALSYDDWNQGVCTSWADAYREVAEMVEDQPTIEAVTERKKGQWIDKDGGLATCSECGDRWGVWSVMNFCPNCGCAMTEGAEDEQTG